MADEQTASYNRKSNPDRHEKVYQEVGMMRIQPCANKRHGGNEQEMQQINIQCALACILQESSQGMFRGKPFLVIAEKHYYHKQQGIHGCSAGKVRPGKFQGVPPEDVGTADQCQSGYKRKKPYSVKKLLNSNPVSVYNIVQKEELYEPDGLYQAGVVKEYILVVFEDLG